MTLTWHIADSDRPSPLLAGILEHACGIPSRMDDLNGSAVLSTDQGRLKIQVRRNRQDRCEISR